MQGWWSQLTLQNLMSLVQTMRAYTYQFVPIQIKTLHALPNRMPADDNVIEDLLVALKGGAEHMQQHGMLMAFIAQCQTTYTRLHGIQGLYLYLAPIYPTPWTLILNM
jgi:hypothetical protein